jgi:4-hydroxybenzoate polyprenyltransferase
VGAEIAGGPDGVDVAYAALMTAFSMNFVYSINSWADWKIDLINKPGRPIPAGKLTRRSAFIYCMFLLAVSVIFPVIVFKSPATLVLFETLPVLGILYSIKPFRFKRFLIPAVATTSLILVVPMMTGYFMNSNDLQILPFFLILFLYCLSVIPLKDIEDVTGDVHHASNNWMDKLGHRSLFIISLSGLALTLLLTAVLSIEPILKIYLYTFISSTMVMILVFLLFRINITRLYKSIIYLVIVEGVTIFSVLYFSS